MPYIYLIIFAKPKLLHLDKLPKFPSIHMFFLYFFNMSKFIHPSDPNSSSDRFMVMSQFLMSRLVHAALMLVTCTMHIQFLYQYSCDVNCIAYVLIIIHK